MQGSQNVQECIAETRGVRGLGFGIGCSEVIQITRDGRRQVGIGRTGVGMVTVMTVREVHDRVLPDRSHKTDEMSGMDLTQEREKVE